MPGKRRRNAAAVVQQPHTLSSFLEENFRLVSVFGILIAVSTFAGNLMIRAMGIAISFLLLLAAIMVWLELLRKFPAGKSNWILFLFKHILTLITLAIILYWLLFFRDYMRPVLIVGLTALLLGAAFELARRGGLLERLFGERAAGHQFPRLLAATVIIVLAVALALALSIAVSNIAAASLTRLLESLYRTLESALAQRMG